MPWSANASETDLMVNPEGGSANLPDVPDETLLGNDSGATGPPTAQTPEQARSILWDGKGVPFTLTHAATVRPNARNGLLQEMVLPVSSTFELQTPENMVVGDTMYIYLDNQGGADMTLGGGFRTINGLGISLSGANGPEDCLIIRKRDTGTFDIRIEEAYS